MLVLVQVLGGDEVVPMLILTLMCLATAHAAGRGRRALWTPTAASVWTTWMWTRTWKRASLRSGATGITTMQVIVALGPAIQPAAASLAGTVITPTNATLSMTAQAMMALLPVVTIMMTMMTQAATANLTSAPAAARAAAYTPALPRGLLQCADSWRAPQ